jgi:hypothetical protein
VQYTPYDHNGGRGRRQCIPQAKVRVYYENHQDPVIEKTWDALPAQQNLKRDESNDTCETIRYKFWLQKSADESYR